MLIAVLYLPQAFASCVSLPCDDANIKLGEPNYRFVDFSYQNKVGEPLSFILEKTAYDQCNSYIATIINENGTVIWSHGIESLCTPPPKEPVLLTSQIKIGHMHPIIISESGKYFIKIEIDDGSIEREFTVRHTFSAISIDRTVYPAFTTPLQQIMSGVTFHNVQCKEELELAYKKADDTSACVTLKTKIELVVRGWAEDNRLLLGCTGERVKKCYPDDPFEYRKALYTYYFGSEENLPPSNAFDFASLHTTNACTVKPWICYGEFENGTKLRVSCDYPIHSCGPVLFDKKYYKENEN